VTVYLARILAPSGYGLISIGLALLGQLSLLSSPGVQMVEARNVASGAGGSRERTGTVLGMRLLLAAGLWCLTTAVLTLVPAFAPIRTLLTFFAASLVPLAAMMDWHFQGREQGLLAGGARLLQSVVYGIFLVLLVHSADDLTKVPLALFIGNAAAAVILLAVFVGLEGMPRVRWDPAGWRKVFVENASVGLAVAMGQLVINFPPVAIGWLLGTAEAGLWGAAMKLVFLVLILDRVPPLCQGVDLLHQPREREDPRLTLVAAAASVVVGERGKGAESQACVSQVAEPALKILQVPV
jgi:O-antigen/teichoic acid export membrane protein